MYRRNYYRFGTVMAISVLFTACGSIAANAGSSPAGREQINQVSLLQGLTYGDYYGSITVSRLKELGDTGIGTFDALNGELIMLDGTVYRAAYDGTVEAVADEETIPFSNVTFFDADETVKLTDIDSVDSLKEELNGKVSETGENRFYMITAEGTFRDMNVRSELPQTEPYRPLAEVLETDQTVFDYENIKGTVVGLYCPSYMSDLNAVGWHFHFISDDRKAGGHVLDLSADELEVRIDRTDGFSMVLPDNEMFNGFDLTVDQSEDIKKVETGEGDSGVRTEQMEAVYLGVDNYGDQAVNKDTKETFRYRFLIDGKEVLFAIDSGEQNEDGEYEYPIQNILKEQYPFRITVEGSVVTAAEEIHDEEVTEYDPVVQGTPGIRTVGNFLKTAMEPVGTTLYIYGGGWDWQDVGSSLQARTIGVSSDWVRFFVEQDENFTFKSKDGNEDNSDPSNSYYPYGGYNEYYYAGLDCSGFLGWALYNTLETEDGKDGYVTFASAYSKMLAQEGYGDYTREIEAPVKNHDCEMKPGDIMSTGGHVWISLGTCSDGSVVVLHSTPADSRTGQPGGGVEVSAIGLSEECEAYQLADRYMSEHYPEWYERYPVKLADPETYFSTENENAGRFAWDPEKGKVKDPDGVRDMTPEQVLDYLFDA